MKDVESHFEFGRNWAEFSRLIDESRVAHAVEGLIRLAGPGAIEHKAFLDIGCGSGIHSVAALELGASRVVAVDLDPHSVTTTKGVLSSFTTETPWEVYERSVFALDSAELGTFDLVYAWGSLHHTGALHEAVECAARMVAPGGVLILAIYQKTRLGRLWRIEKSLYTRSPKLLQTCIRTLYIIGFRTFFLLRRRSFREYRDSYPETHRGMDFYRDVHDWLGGYPYEEISPAEAEELRGSIGFAHVRRFGDSRTPLGVFGGGCDEYVWQRPRQSADLLAGDRGA
jgi:2-polyprenyl-6-hydroxyphenyl methylase/3-demethylubiquinone-9 3-methyltransferase